MKRYTALGWVVWKIMSRVLQRKAARNCTRLTAWGVILGVVVGWDRRGPQEEARVGGDRRVPARRGGAGRAQPRRRDPRLPPGPRLARPWSRSSETLAAVEARGALALEADAADLAALGSALARVREVHGSLDLVVNAVSASRPPGSGPFGGGRSPTPRSRASAAGRSRWPSSPSPSSRRAPPRCARPAAGRWCR